MSVLRRINPTHTVILKFLNLSRNNHPTATAKYPNICTPPLCQHVNHVLKKLGVATLVGTDSDALRIFFYGRINNFLDRSVVPKVDDFHAGRLKNTPHDVDRRIMAIKQACCGDESDAVIRFRQRRQWSFRSNSSLTHEYWAGQVWDG